MSNYNELDTQQLVALLSEPRDVEKISPSIIYTCEVCDKTIAERRFSPTFISNNIKNIFGYEPTEILGNDLWWQDHLHPDDKPRILSGLERLFERGHLGHEYRFRHSNGDYLWVQDDLAIVPDDRGNPAQIVGAWRDMTLRRRTIGELRKYEAQCRELFENMIDVYYRTDMDGRLDLVSPSCLAQTGYTQEELLGRPVTMLHADPSKREQLLERLHEKGIVNDFEAKFIHKNGSSGYASLTCRFVRDQNDRPVAIEGIVRDITARHRAEEKLSTLLQENRKLTLQMMMLQEEERRLLARELHDELAQLLTGIAARAEYISSQSSDADIASKADEISRDTDALFQLSHAILKRLRPAALDTLGLSAALEELVSNWGEQAAVECSLTSDECIDHLDETHRLAIYRVVQEGLSNACRHGKADRVDITLRCSLSAPEKRTRMVHIEIEDNGGGIHAENVAAGMGMIGMRERVQALGGTFLITNLPDDGARLEASIPLDEKEVPGYEQ